MLESDGLPGQAPDSAGDAVTCLQKRP